MVLRFQRERMVPEESEIRAVMMARKLLISGSSRTAKNAGNAPIFQNDALFDVSRLLTLMPAIIRFLEDVKY